jgi:metal-sulfur cluster biosynthetic enzyme
MVRRPGPHPGASLERAMISEEAVQAALHEVNDPEVGVNIVDLGLIYAVRIRGTDVAIDMTSTTPACPLADFLEQEIQRALRAHLPEVEQITVNLVWDPPWTPERMSDAARQHLGWNR